MLSILYHDPFTNYISLALVLTNHIWPRPHSDVSFNQSHPAQKTFIVKWKQGSKIYLVSCFKNNQLEDNETVRGWYDNYEIMNGIRNMEHIIIKKAHISTASLCGSHWGKLRFRKQISKQSLKRVCSFKSFP